jgi:tetratricopeptide (TPR) repeat protein
VIHASFSPDGRRVVTTSTDHTARIWELVPDNRPAEDLLLLAQLLARHKIDSSGSLTALETATLSNAWERLRSKYPQTFRRLPEEIEAWHWQEAETGERMRRQSAPGHIRMAMILLNDPDQKKRNARRAVELVKQALDEDPHGNYWEKLGMAHYQAGDWKEAVAALDKAIASVRHDAPWPYFLLANAHYRAGEWKQTLATLEKAISSAGSGAPLHPDHCFLMAMAFWQAGQKEAARKWYDRGARLKNERRGHPAEDEDLQAEAETLLGIEKNKGQKSPPPSKGS